jgi:hypothetical protein
LRQLVAQSLGQLKEKLLTELLHQVDLLDGRVDDFTRKQVPHQVTQAVRGWAEVRGREIEGFLAKLVERLAEDYARAFATPLDLAGLPATISLPEFQAERTAAEGSRVEEFVKYHLLPTVAPLAGGWLLLGPLGMLCGMALGRFAEAKFNADRLERQKVEARDVIRREVTAGLDQFAAAADSGLCAWFDRLEQLLADEARGKVAAAERRFLESADSPRRALESARDKVEGIIRQLSEEICHG